MYDGPVSRRQIAFVLLVAFVVNMLRAPIAVYADTTVAPSFRTAIPPKATSIHRPVSALRATRGTVQESIANRAAAATNLQAASRSRAAARFHIVTTNQRAEL